ncbi:hypothetical protein Ahia01_001161400 [Argonauta hians]
MTPTQEVACDDTNGLSSINYIKDQWITSTDRSVPVYQLRPLGSHGRDGDEVYESSARLLVITIRLSENYDVSLGSFRLIEHTNILSFMLMYKTAESQHYQPFGEQFSATNTVHFPPGFQAHYIQIFITDRVDASKSVKILLDIRGCFEPLFQQHQSTTTTALKTPATTTTAAPSKTPTITSPITTPPPTISTPAKTPLSTPAPTTATLSKTTTTQMTPTQEVACDDTNGLSSINYIKDQWITSTDRSVPVYQLRPLGSHGRDGDEVYESSARLLVITIRLSENYDVSLGSFRLIEHTNILSFMLMYKTAESQHYQPFGEQFSATNTVHFPPGFQAHYIQIFITDRVDASKSVKILLDIRGCFEPLFRK